MNIDRPNPWAGAVVVKLTPIRGGSPIAFFDARFPAIEATIVGCTLRRTKVGRLWCSPPKQRRLLSDGTTQYDDIIAWDGGGAATRFSDSCVEAIQRHSPELLTPTLEGSASPAPTALPRHRDTRSDIALPSHAPDWWGDGR
jgi:hypothetical protein